MVEERVVFDRDQGDLARGFALGRLNRKRLEKGSEELRIEPGLDFKSGLFQVIVLAPPLPGGGVVEAAGFAPDAVAIDVSKFAASGSGYRVVNVVDYYGKPVAAGKITGKTVRLPMKGHRYEPEFGAYVLTVDRPKAKP